MMIASAGARSPLFTLAISAGFVLIFIFGFLAWQSPPRIPFPKAGKIDVTISDQKPVSSIQDIIKTLYAPMKLSPTEPFILEAKGEKDEDADKLELPPKPRYQKPLGRRVLVLDLDTRPLPSTEDYEQGNYHWSKLNHVSAGVFNHYTYALVHGYDYKFIHASEFSDRHATWIKPSALANHIKDYKFIVFLDADATFRWLHLPIEWMLNYWKIEPQHAITMALDPWDPKSPQYNSDRFNRTYTNTGFMVVQNNEHIMPMLQAWHECPDDTRYKGCSEWKEPRFHEQSAFGEYIRYDFDQYIKELPCAEANGFPGVEISQCQGRFIRHYWFEKSLVKKDFRENMMNALTMPIQQMFADNTNGIIVEQNENVIP